MNGDALLQTLESKFGALTFAPMQLVDMDAVVAIEEKIYVHPWTRGNFLDSLHSHYQTLTIRDPSGRLLGYFLVMEALDEAHLLNISVAEDRQGEGFGHLLLDYAVDLARQHRMSVMLLEVRVSNLRALHVYRRYGFTEIGRRKNYYLVDQHTREDAIVMNLPL